MHSTHGKYSLSDEAEALMGRAHVFQISGKPEQRWACIATISPANGAQKAKVQEYWTPVYAPGPLFTSDALTIDEGVGVYFSVNTFAKPARRHEALASVKCLYADFDAKLVGGKSEALALAKGAPLPPHAIVDTGGGYHAYWFLEYPMLHLTPDKQAAVIKGWAALVGGDPKAALTTQLLRLPGSYNYKPEHATPYPVKVVEWDESDGFYKSREFEALSRSKLAQEKLAHASETIERIPTRTVTARPGAYAEAALEGEVKRMRAAREGERNATLFKAAANVGELVAAGALERAAAEGELIAAAMATGLPEGEARATVESALRHTANKPRQVPEPRKPSRARMTAPNGKARALEGRPDEGDEGDEGDAEEEGLERGRSKGSSPTQDELAERWLLAHPDTVWGMGSYRRYEAGAWRAISETQAKNEILRVLKAAKGEGVRPSAGLLEGVYTLAKAEHDVYIAPERWDANPDIVVVANGALDVKKRKLGPHAREHYALSATPYPYDERADAPVFRRVLEECLPDESTRELLLEFGGYALTVDTSHEAAVWLVGPPGSGKSTIVGAFQAALGERAGLLGLADIERSRFALSTIPGKTLLVSTENPAAYTSVTHTLNALISGEPLLVERKFQEPFLVQPRGKLLWALNSLPRVSDANDGLFRRVRVVKFTALPTRDTTVKERIALEGSGVLNMFLDGLDRLRARGAFTVSARVEAATREYRERNDAEADFLRECCERGPAHHETATALLLRLNEFLEANGYRKVGRNTAAAAWERLGLERREMRSGTVYRGARILANEEMRSRSSAALREAQAED